MKYNLDHIKENDIRLLDCQCETILKCMEYYCYSANFLLERNGKYTNREDEKKIALITDTYEQFLKQFADSKSNKIAGSQKAKKIS